jgi:hypothetical protein
MELFFWGILEDSLCSTGVLRFALAMISRRHPTHKEITCPGVMLAKCPPRSGGEYRATLSELLDAIRILRPMITLIESRLQLRTLPYEGSKYIDHDSSLDLAHSLRASHGAAHNSYQIIHIPLEIL